MAGIFDFLGASSPQAGVLASATPAPGASRNAWANGIGLFGSTLRDVGANLSGNPQAAHNIADFSKLQQQQAVQQALAAASSPDPTIRAKAYAVARANGIDTTAFERAAAAGAMPDLLKQMQPQINPVQSTPMVTPDNPINSPMRQAIQAAPVESQPTLSDALSHVNSPELQAQMAPEIIKQQIEQQQKAMTTLPPEQVAQLGFRPGTIVQQDAYGNLKVAQASDLKSQAAVDQQHQIELNKPNPNQPFNNDGTANKAYQEWELRKEKASGAGSSMAGWQLLVDPKSNVPYRYNVRTGQALDFSGQPYTPQGASHVASGQVRSAASLAAQRFVQEHPNATAADIAQFSADFGATGKSVGAFSTGKQGDLIRSFNVGIAHLNTLDGLVGALGNGNIQAFNKLGNAYAQQTGNPAPANFDAAKAIVGDEIIKAIVGGGGALADRENAQNQINRANSPQQLAGVIKTYKTLMAGQLDGLKKQYADTTHRNNFDSRLSPEAQSELEAPHRGPSTLPPNPASLPRKPAAGKIRVYNPATGRLE